MTGAWEDDRWADDLESWEELADLLRNDWDRVEHPSLGLSLERADGLPAFDLRGRWHARHRRGPHRLGFRPVALGSPHVWQWDVEPQLRATDLSRFASPFESIFGVDPSAARAVRLRTLLARDHLVREQALHVLREVFRCEPADLEVLLVREDDDWEEHDGCSLHGPLSATTAGAAHQYAGGAEQSGPGRPRVRGPAGWSRQSTDDTRVRRHAGPPVPLPASVDGGRSSTSIRARASAAPPPDP